MIVGIGGRIVVRVLAAKNLPIMDVVGTADPYCVISCGELHVIRGWAGPSMSLTVSVGGETHRTKTIQNTRGPSAWPVAH